METGESNMSNQRCEVLKDSSWYSQFRNVCNPWLARYVYALIFLVANLLAWAARDELSSLTALTQLKGVKGCKVGKDCLGADGVLRVSMGCFLFYMIMFWSTAGTSKLKEGRDEWHSGWWLVKTVLLILVTIFPFLLPSKLIELYGEVAHFGIFVIDSVEKMMGEVWSQLGSLMASIMFVYAMYEQFFPRHLRIHATKYTQKFTAVFYPYIQISFSEFSGERLKRSEAYTAIRTYLSANSSQRVRRLKAEEVKDSQNPLIFSMEDNEEITDEFQGVQLWWRASYKVPKTQSFSFYPTSEEKRFLTLTFHKRHRDLVTASYIQHVMKQGRDIAVQNRTLKLYTNNPSKDWSGYKQTKWSHVNFEHPSTFQTLAMDPKKKEEIVDDLDRFKAGKEYYAKVGKAWKRGYLLYGPPGTGKSSMIAAMANYMNYDVYDLELTAVKENTDLRKLLIETSSKSIIVIEDIDCSIDLTGQRKKKKEKDEDEEKPKNPEKKAEEEEKKGSKVTLSGLLNFIDGIWSACGGERIIIFTTNFVDKLDPALIRRGRMDKHIEMSYCGYEAFKVLAKNYLGVESHTLFPTIEKLLGETNMPPADVAENLMPKSIVADSELCLKSLIESLEEAKKKAEEEAEKKAKEDEEARLKEELAKEEKVEANGKSGEEVKENGSVH